MLDNSVQTVGISTWPGVKLSQFLHTPEMLQILRVFKLGARPNNIHTQTTTIHPDAKSFFSLLFYYLYTLSTSLLTNTTTYINNILGGS